MAAEIAALWVEHKAQKNIADQRRAEVISYLFATSTDETSNAANNHNHKTHFPKLTQIYDNLKANYVAGLIPNEQWFDYESWDTKGVRKDVRAKLKAYIRTKHRQTNFPATLSRLVDDWILGNAFCEVAWFNESHTLPETGEEVRGYTGPRVLRIDPESIVFNPTASSFRDTWKIIRSLHTLGDLARMIEDRPDSAYIRDVWDRVKKLRGIARGLDVHHLEKARQYAMDGFGSWAQYIKSPHVELLHFYGDLYDVDTGTLYKNHCITVVDRCWVIRNVPVDTWDGKPMIFKAGYRDRPDNLWSQGALDNLLGMQYYIDHIENARADALDDMIVYDVEVRGSPEITVDSKGRKIYHFDQPQQGDGVNKVAPDTAILSSDMKIREMKEEMEQYAGAPREGIGVRSPGEKTKFEVQTLENSRGRFFQHNMTNFEVQMLEPILNSELLLAMKYLDGRESIIMEEDEYGLPQFGEISKEDLVHYGKLRPIGARHYARMSQMAQNLMALQSQALVTDPDVQLHFPSIKIAEMWEELLEFDKYNLMQPYARIPERAQAQRLMQAAMGQVEEEGLVDVAGDGGMDETQAF